jgi:hypothetical protein
VPPTTTLPAGACKRARVPDELISVNSSNGPLNCSEYDSAFDAIDAQPPADGIASGRSHASTEMAGAVRSVALGILTKPVDPSVATALSGSFVSSPACPSSTPPTYEPGCVPLTSFAVVPDVSPSRQ